MLVGGVVIRLSGFDGEETHYRLYTSSSTSTIFHRLLLTVYVDKRWNMTNIERQLWVDRLVFGIWYIVSCVVWTVFK